ncbi:uncharacterized protein LOC126779906 [Nymphalis io]|uniref:uncharacterized protein LOC126779906 n=1 Tax=Inachis io TaxID=171585 RepID=UPI0021675103|nr:uncharacterized protein LOC126779906 [Nymphalis io]
MASKKMLRASKFIATLAEKQTPCAFCQRMVDEETTYGKLYRIGDIHCHYFCVLLSCCLIQRGKDEDGLFGFLYPDILAEIERSKKHKCSYCSREGATLGCSVSQCRKQFHLPCGREKQAVSLFYGNYKSFCKDHAPKQKISETIMAKAKVRMSISNKIKREKRMQNSKKVNKEIISETDGPESVESVCVICYESVDGFPTNQTFWPPCCGRDAWFHRSCLERMALSAGVHYLKCPLCNDKDNFYKAVLDQGYYIPDRDAAWELEQNAFSDIYERSVVCSVEDCKCPMGREYDADSGPWDISLCVLCGGAGAHAQCGRAPRVCAACAPARPPPRALSALAHAPLPSQSGNAPRRRTGPVMPSRMSLRRTKARSALNISSTSTENNETKSIIEVSRQELNLKAPKGRISERAPLENVENKLLSPLKLLNKDLYDRILNEKSLVLDQNVLEEVRHKFKRPKPLVVKKKIINEILERFINNISKEKTKTKEPIREWNSPKKLHDEETTMEENITNIEPKTIEEINLELNNIEVNDISKEVETENENLLDDDDDSNSTFQLPSEFIADYNSDQSLPIFDTPKKLKKINIENDSIEISENDQVINVDLIKTEGDMSVNNETIENNKYALKFSTFNKEVLENNNLDIDIETFKNQYLSEVDRQFNTKQKDKVNDDLKGELCNADEPKLKKPPKRKLRTTNSVASKRRKTTKMVENKKNERIEKSKRKSKTHLSIRNKNINLKIKFRDEELKLKISKRKRKNKKINKDCPKVLRQYVLSCMDNVISRPDYDVVPLKKQYLKTEKATDNLKQTSLDHFFKIKPQRT